MAFLSGYDDRRTHRDRSWEGRSSIDRERGYLHPHKDWDNEDYRAAGDWGRDRRWPMHESQVRLTYKMLLTDIFMYINPAFYFPLSSR